MSIHSLSGIRTLTFEFTVGLGIVSAFAKGFLVLMDECTFSLGISSAFLSGVLIDSIHNANPRNCLDFEQ